MYLWIYHVRHQGLYLWRDGRIERWQFVAIGAPAGHVRSGFGPGGPLADVVLMVFLDFEVDLAAATAFPSLSVLIFVRLACERPSEIVEVTLAALQ